MLQTLSIRGIVLIERLTVEFQPGLSVLTGETGAGKSILLDALGLALGARADSALVRPGVEAASIAATFEVPVDHAARALIAEHGIEADGDGPLILRRTLTPDGRSRAFVNDQPVSVGLLRRLGDVLVDIHGQFDNQRLISPLTHRRLLDAHGGLGRQAAAVVTAWQAWQEARAASEAAATDTATARRDEDLLRHANSTLAALDPKLGEEETLAQSRAMMMHGEKLLEAIRQASAELQGGRGAESTLRAAVRHLERAAALADGRFAPTIALLDQAAEEAAEAVSQLERLAGAVDLDPRRLEVVEERLFALRGEARKHGVGADDLPALRQSIAGRLAAIEDGGAAQARLDRLTAERCSAYTAAADKLSEARRRASRKLDTAVAGELEPLRLGGARFKTVVDPLPEAEWGPQGRDHVVFQVATNPGQAPGPLGRISSGGELARFMLALKVVLARADPVPTIVFDEVDAGVGGAVAAAVGERLARLAEDFQVLVVTHSPQVAARGLHHWRVSKSMNAPGAHTAVDILEEADRREEIARMLAGIHITDEARAAAASLLADRMDRTPP